MEKILVSACLLGQKVRYDGRELDVPETLIRQWLQEGRLISTCPEVSGGLPVPRPPAEIQRFEGGTAPLSGLVKDVSGNDVSLAYRMGAEHALALAREHDIRIAILKEKSPSCGVHQVYDGSFRSVLADGEGVTTALLRRHGVRVFSEVEIEAAGAYLAMLESTSTT